MERQQHALHLLAAPLQAVNNQHLHINLQIAEDRQLAVHLHLLHALQVHIVGRQAHIVDHQQEQAVVAAALAEAQVDVDNRILNTKIIL